MSMVEEAFVGSSVGEYATVESWWKQGSQETVQFTT